MEFLILGGYIAFFGFGFLYGRATAQSTTNEAAEQYAHYEQEQLDRQWQALFSYDPINPKEEFDDNETYA